MASRASSGSPVAKTRCDAALLAGAVLLFLTGYFGALLAPRLSYSWDHDMVSDLGRASCRTWQGAWVCSPRAHWFNAFIAGSGALLLLAVTRLRALWGPIFSAGVGSLGAGLLWLALFPSDGALPLHMVGAVLALPLPASLVFISGVRAETPWSWRDRLRQTLGLIALILCLDHVMPAPAPLPRGGVETFTVVILLVLLSIEAARLYRHSDNLTA